MRRITQARIAASRTLSRALLRRGEMLCAIADWHRWRGRHLLNAIFLDRSHCADAADWEARQDREPDALDDWRRAGWM